MPVFLSTDINSVECSNSKFEALKTVMEIAA